MRWLLFISAYACVGTGWSAPKPPFYSPLPMLGTTHCKALALNDKGLAVGRFQSSVIFGRPPERACLLMYDQGAPTPLPLLRRGGFDLERAYDQNEHGVVVDVSTLTNGQRRAFRYRNGKMKSLGTLGGTCGT